MSLLKTDIYKPHLWANYPQLYRSYLSQNESNIDSSALSIFYKIVSDLRGRSTVRVSMFMGRRPEFPSPGTEGFDRGVWQSLPESLLNQSAKILFRKVSQYAVYITELVWFVLFFFFGYGFYFFFFCDFFFFFLNMNRNIHSHVLYMYKFSSVMDVFFLPSLYISTSSHLVSA